MRRKSKAARLKPGATSAWGRACQYGNVIKPSYETQIPHFVQDDKFLLFFASCEASRYKCRGRVFLSNAKFGINDGSEVGAGNAVAVNLFKSIQLA
jgi:hypothetical protein